MKKIRNKYCDFCKFRKWQKEFQEGTYYHPMRLCHNCFNGLKNLIMIAFFGTENYMYRLNKLEKELEALKKQKKWFHKFKRIKK